MIQKFVDRWMSKKDEAAANFKSSPPESYCAIVRAVVDVLNDEDDFDTPDPDRITKIDHGSSYEGTFLYVIASEGYSPDEFWYVKVGYGSCSACDTLEGILGYEREGILSDKQTQDIMTLALHIVQGIKPMDSEAVYD